jgi:hypothetical protein
MMSFTANCNNNDLALKPNTQTSVMKNDGDYRMNIESVDLRWKDLYRIAGIAAIISEVIIFLGIVTYFIWPYAPGQETAESILLFLQSDRLGGLISLDFFLFVGNLFSITLFLAFYVSLKQVNESYALIALVLGLIAVTLLIPSRPIIEMFSLSRSYANADTPLAKSQTLAAAEALLALFSGTNWFMNTLIGSISLLISSLLMLRSNLYSRSIAYVGIFTNVVVCGFFIPVVGPILLFLSLPGYMIWYFQLARRFFQMARGY